MGQISSILQGAQIGVQRGREIMLRPIAINERASTILGINTYGDWQNFSNDYWTEALYNPSTLNDVSNDWTENPFNPSLTSDDGPLTGFNDYLAGLGDSANDDFGGDSLYGDWNPIEEFNDERSQTIQLYENDFFDSYENSMWGDQWGGENNNFGLNILGTDAEGTYNLNIGADGIVVGANAEGNLYLVQAEGQAGNNFIGIAGEGQIGVHGEAGADLTYNPITGIGDLSIQGEISGGASLNLTPRVGLGDYFQAEVDLNANIGPSLSGEFLLNNESGGLDPDFGVRFRPGLDLDADLDYTLNSELIWNDATDWFTDTEFYNSTDDWLTEIRLNDGFDHNAGYPLADDNWSNFEIEGNGFEVNDLVTLDLNNIDLDTSNLFDSVDYNSNTFDLGIDTFDVNTIDLDTSGIYDPIEDSWMTYDTGITFDAGSLDVGSVDVGSIDVGAFDIGGLDYGGFDYGGFDYGGFDMGGFDFGGLDFGFDYNAFNSAGFEFTTMDLYPN